MAKHSFAAQIPRWMSLLIVFVLVVIGVIAWVVSISNQIGVSVLGLFVEMAGVVFLTLGLVKTNDDLLFLAKNSKKADVQTLITRHASERFIIMLGLFCIVVGLLLQIVGIIAL